MSKLFAGTKDLQARTLALFMGLLFLSACGQSGGSSKQVSSMAPSCVSAQDLSTAFQMAKAEAQISRSGNLEVLVQFENPNDMKSLIQEIKSTGESQVRWTRLSSSTLSLRLIAGSQAEKIVDRFVSEGRIQGIEKDHETFSTQVFEDSAAASEDSAVASEDSSAGGGNSAVASEGSSASVNAQEVTAQAAQGLQGKEVIVAIIDTGVDYTHKDLAPYMWRNSKEITGNGIDDDGNGFIDDVVGWDFANNDNDPMADDTRSYHGTHVAGIVKQAAQLAEKGINVKIMALKYLNENAAGRTSVAIQAIDYAIQNGASILNNSWGSFSYSSALAEAIERARAKKVLFVAASGNGDAQGNGVNIDQNPFYPAAYAINNVVSVAASDEKNQLAEWSNYGAVNVDFSGPGVQIRSTRNGNTYGTLSGTSMAAPYISGVAAMIWSLRPELSYVEVRKILAQSVETDSSLSGKVLTGGAINRSQALMASQSYIHNPNDNGAPEATPSGVVCQR